MIIVQLTSGLGNQMFQYAFYRLMQERYPDTPVKMDLTWFNVYREHNGYELERIFKREDNPRFGFERATAGEIAKVTGRIPPVVPGAFGPVFDKLRYYPNRVIRLFTEKKKKPFMISQTERENAAEETGEEENGAKDIGARGPFAEGVPSGLYRELMHLDMSRDWYLSGFWIEEVWYRDRLGGIREELAFDTAHMDPENREWAGRIEGCESVGVHVRRGDYTGKYAGEFCVLGREYYREAAETLGRLTGGVEKLKFFLFSDDPSLAEKEFDWLPDKEIVSCNRGNESYRDMQLMSLCSHNILANSTFSVWAALLNKNPGHLTVYPRRYMPGRDNELKTLPGWHRVG